MKALSAALAGVLALSAAAPAAAQRHGGGGGHAGGWGGHASGGWSGGSGAWAGRSPGGAVGAPASGGWSRGAGWSHGSPHAGGRPAWVRGYPHYRGYRGYPYFGGFAAGYVTALALSDPSYWWGPFYGGWWGDETVTVTPYYDYGPPPPADYAAPPPADEAAPPPAACGSWAWDAQHQVYNWIPCPPPSAG